MKRLMSTNRFGTSALAAAAVLLVLAAGPAGAAQAKKDAPRASRGYIGVYMQDLTDGVRKGLNIDVSKGVLVSGVEEDGPADRAGLEDGDVIVSFNGKSVESPEDLRRLVRDVEPGTTAKMKVVHDGKSKTIEVAVAERPDDFGYAFGRMHMPDMPEVGRALAMFGGGPRLGIRASDIDSEDMASYFKVKPGDGVLVLDVDENSVASKAGIKPGDVIQKIGDDAVSSVDDIRKSCRELEKGDEFTIGVLRHGKSESLKATMDETPQGWAFNEHGGHWGAWRHPAPREYMSPNDRDELRRELDELKRELQEMKEKMGNQDG